MKSLIICINILEIKKWIKKIQRPIKVLDFVQEFIYDHYVL